jgi:hypothetical protein
MLSDPQPSPLQKEKRNAYVNTNGGTATGSLTASQVLAKLVYVTPSAASNFTLPTAAALVAMDSLAQVGDGFTLYLSNRSGTYAATVVAGTGATLAGLPAVVASATGSQWYINYTNVTSGTQAYTATRIL